MKKILVILMSIVSLSVFAETYQVRKALSPNLQTPFATYTPPAPPEMTSGNITGSAVANNYSLDRQSILLTNAPIQGDFSATLTVTRGSSGTTERWGTLGIWVHSEDGTPLADVVDWARYQSTQDWGTVRAHEPSYSYSNFSSSWYTTGVFVISRTGNIVTVATPFKTGTYTVSGGIQLGIMASTTDCCVETDNQFTAVLVDNN